MQKVIRTYNSIKRNDVSNNIDVFQKLLDNGYKVIYITNMTEYIEYILER